MGTRYLKTSFLVTGAAGTLDQEPKVQRVTLVTSVGGYALSLVPRLGVDGVSLWLVALNALLMPLAILASWKAVAEALTARSKAQERIWLTCSFIVFDSGTMRAAERSRSSRSFARIARCRAIEARFGCATIRVLRQR